jgi:hypothetical protein
VTKKKSASWGYAHYRCFGLEDPGGFSWIDLYMATISSESAVTAMGFIGPLNAKMSIDPSAFVNM